MAQLVAACGVPHTPLLWREIVDPVPDDLVGTRARFTEFRERLTASGAETLVVLSSDHFRKFMYDNSPAFTIGKAPRFPTTYENERRTFGFDHWEARGDEDLAAHLLGGRQLPDEFDFGWSNEWVIDHSMSIPLVYLRPEWDLPIVPINANTNMPPIPTPGRLARLGGWLREAIERYPDDRKVALITSGHLATDIGGPRQFLGGASPDEEFDRQGVEWMATGDLDGAVAGCTFERLVNAGNVTLQYLNFLVALAAAGGKPATVAEGTPSRFGNEPFFWWDL